MKSIVFDLNLDRAMEELAVVAVVVTREVHHLRDQGRKMVVVTWIDFIRSIR